MNREQRINWFIHSLGLKEINGNKGTVNCGHCALRMDTYIAQGGTKGAVKPVTRDDANLFSLPTYKDNQIKRTRIEDSRVLARAKYPELNSESFVMYDITNEQGGPVLDLTFEVNQEIRQSSVRLTKAQKDLSLAEQLRDCPRRAKDGTAYGFIWLTHNNLNAGHVINYFVDSSDNNDEVYFIDAQSGEVVDESFFIYFHPDVFYLPSYPPEGFRIKSSPEENTQIKIEKIETIKTENDIFVDQVILAVKERDENALKNLSAQKSIFRIRNSNQLNVMNLIAFSNDETSMEDCLWFAKYGGNFRCAAVGAAFGGHLPLMNAFIEKITAVSPAPINYNQLAAAAARGGQEGVMNFLIKKMQDSVPPIFVDYRLLAVAAAEGGQESLMYSMKILIEGPFEPLVHLKMFIAAAAQGGQESLMHKLINQIPEQLRAKELDYNYIISRAAIGGHQSLVDNLIKEISQLNPSYVLDLNRFAAAAAQGGHVSLMNRLINQMIASGTLVNYNFIASTLAMCGIWSEIDKLITKMKSSNPPIPVNYNGIASCAASGGQEHIVKWMVNEMRKANPAIAINSQQILYNAKKGGYDHLADKLKGLLLSEPAADKGQKRQSDAVPDIETQPGKRQKIIWPSAGPGLFTQDPPLPHTSEVERLKQELAKAASLIKRYQSQHQWQKQQIAGKELEINGLKQQIDGLKKQNMAFKAQLDEAQENTQFNSPGNGI